MNEKSHSFTYTLWGLALGLIAGVLIYAVTDQVYYLLVTAAFGLVTGAWADRPFQDRNLPGGHPSR